MTATKATTPLRAIIFDEDRADARALAQLVEDLQLQVPVETREVWHTTDLSPALASGTDLLFMDLGNQTRPFDGVDLVQALVPDGSGVRIVFTGGGTDAHRRVYLVDHLWRLPKPIDRLELANAMERAVRVIGEDRERPLAVRSGRADAVLIPRDILYVESQLRILRIHEGGRVVETYGNIAEIAGRLPTRFVRCHKSYLVNLDHVRSLGERSLVLVTGDEIPVSQRRHTATREALYEHFGSIA